MLRAWSAHSGKGKAVCRTHKSNAHLVDSEIFFVFLKYEQHTCILLQRSVQFGQAGFQITLGCLRLHRPQLHVVPCLNALAVALGDVVQLTLVLVMIQCYDLQGTCIQDKAIADS